VTVFRRSNIIIGLIAPKVKILFLFFLFFMFFILNKLGKKGDYKKGDGSIFPLKQVHCKVEAIRIKIEPSPF
jgi:hypothetical protein